MATTDNSALLCVQTDAGLAKILSAQRNGLDGVISHIGFGTEAYEPSRSQTELRDERARISLGGGEKADPHTLILQGLLDSSPQFWCREIGIFLDDGTMIAVWSHPTKPRWYKTTGISVAVAYILTFEALPADSVTINVTGPSVNLVMAGPIAQMSAEIIRLQRRAVESENARLIPEIQTMWS